MGASGDEPEVDEELQRALQISYESSVGRGRGDGGGGTQGVRYGQTVIGGGVRGGRGSGRAAAVEDLPAWLLDEVGRCTLNQVDP
jgi:hypothetical protein